MWLCTSQRASQGSLGEVMCTVNKWEKENSGGGGGVLLVVSATARAPVAVFQLAKASKSRSAGANGVSGSERM